MRMAYIGWGSLIWDPRDLPLRSEWNPDGPELRVEFARISKNKRATLVLFDEAPPSRTLWATAAAEERNEAVKNLSRREGCSPEGIGFAHRDEEPCGDVHSAVVSWLQGRGLDVGIWTALESNWEKKRGRPWTPADLVAYLRELSGRDAELAREYIENAPRQVRTPGRDAVERELGWRAARG